jgi:hypothetical protein
MFDLNAYLERIGLDGPEPMRTIFGEPPLAPYSPSRALEIRRFK